MVIEIFWDEVFMVRDIVKMDNLDVWPLSVENDMLLKYNNEHLIHSSFNLFKKVYERS